MDFDLKLEPNGSFDGRIHVDTTEYPLDQAVEVYDKLRAGQITGRAVLVPDGP